jgi:hypothetical protein
MKMCKKLFILSLILGIGFGAGSASADLAGSEVERLGAYWLSPTLTQTLTYNQVVAELKDPDSHFYGYGIASLSQVNDLVASFGITVYSHSYDGIVGTPDELFDNFGYTAKYKPYANLKGYILEDFDALNSYYVRAYDSLDGTNYGYQHWDDFYTDKEDYFYGTIGTWLVKDASVVPLPGAVWLLGSGLVGLAGGLRKN